MTPRLARVTAPGVALALAAALAGCGEENMRDQPRGNAFKGSAAFSDGAAARSWAAGAVPRQPSPYEADDLARPAPRPTVTMDQMLLGQQRFNTFCSPCHAEDGSGQGMIPRHTFPQPPSFHTDETRALSDDDLYRVITSGLGKMPPYANQVIPEERWAVVAYIRALQRSQHATVADAPEWSGARDRTKGAAP